MTHQQNTIAPHVIKQILLSGAALLILVLSYIAFWAVKYRIPAGPPRVIDLRNSTQDKAYCVSFCASLADNPVGFPGHAYVVWSPSDSVCIEKDRSLGFMPRHFSDQIKSLVVEVPGAVFENVRGNNRNVETLTLKVAQSDYSRSLHLASLWRADTFKAGKKDCVSFVRFVAAGLGLKTKPSAFEFPQDFLRDLKELN